MKYWKSGDPFVWLTGGALALCLLMVFGLLALIMVFGLNCFWPAEVVRFTLKDGSVLVGQITDREKVPHVPDTYRIQVKQGNRDLYGNDFVWIDEAKIERREVPPDVLIMERREWGNFYGTIAEDLSEVQKRLPEALEIADRIRSIEKSDIGEIMHEQEKLRLEARGLEKKGVTAGPKVDRINAELAELQKRFEELSARRHELREKLKGTVTLQAAGGPTKTLPMEQIVRIYQPNRMGLFGKLGFYVSKLWEFVADEPRESNTEGGIFPAIFGTVMMVFIMSLMVTPLGILAALYLREYAKQGTLVSLVRIAVNNLAGVPSIVFGVFGVGFFIYTVGGQLDEWFFSEALPTPTFGTGGILWASLTLALLTVPVVIVATEEGLASIPRSLREGSLALGANKFETTWRVVLPALAPSILTGLILAMARAAGEVAPLMITGVVKLAPALPLDGYAPYFHLDRKFMHLGFHIYDVGFQSPNVDAARPMVYMTTLLLLVIVVALNLTAIVLRKRLRKRFAMSAV
jgi:phosphate transport system permease protein